MNDDKETIKALKGLLITVHEIRQGEHIRYRIRELECKGLSADEVLTALRTNPPVLTPNI
ncbi:hypothetical protein [Pseudomonas sp. Ant30-3]|uniref:hypothetical protein n=1 Tax=Pseudomonas sp. Ant30-3 TaxID=1488328 RepID=UPI0004919A75|nr:hypothetical protein [Pseudomonas sp. Ant30-3]